MSFLALHIFPGRIRAVQRELGDSKGSFGDVHLGVVHVLLQNIAGAIQNLEAVSYESEEVVYAFLDDVVNEVRMESANRCYRAEGCWFEYHPVRKTLPSHVEQLG